MTEIHSRQGTRYTRGCARKGDSEIPVRSRACKRTVLAQGYDKQTDGETSPSANSRDEAEAAGDFEQLQYIRTVRRRRGIWSQEVRSGDESKKEDQAEDGESEGGVCAYGAKE